MAQLYLEIDGVLYAVTRTGLPLGAWRLLQLHGGKRSGASYGVSVADGACDCPDALYRPREEGCKHQRALVEAGLVAPRRGAPILSRGDIL